MEIIMSRNEIETILIEWAKTKGWKLDHWADYLNPNGAVFVGDEE